VLDIGWGSGLMESTVWQVMIAQRTSLYIGVEPDPLARPLNVFTELIRSPFEQADLAADSVDLACASMLLEHVARPRAFFDHLAKVLSPGGVFWAFTVDRRHYFSWFSQLLQASGWKDRFLDRVRGFKGHSAARYDNYPTCYRCNSPRRLARLVTPQFTVKTWGLHRVGQLEGYVPCRLRRLSRWADRLWMALGLPGSVQVVRLVRTDRRS